MFDALAELLLAANTYKVQLFNFFSNCFHAWLMRYCQKGTAAAYFKHNFMQNNIILCL